MRVVEFVRVLGLQVLMQPLLRLKRADNCKRAVVELEGTQGGWKCARRSISFSKECGVLVASSEHEIRVGGAFDV